MRLILVFKGVEVYFLLTEEVGDRVLWSEYHDCLFSPTTKPASITVIFDLTCSTTTAGK